MQYTQRHLLDVGDVPGHQVSLYVLHVKFTNEAPVYGGVKVVEAWNWQQGDLVDGNGRSWGYQVRLLENGDKLFFHLENVVHSTAAPDGARKTSFTSVFTLTGGTGKFKGIRGTFKLTGFTDLKTGLGDTVEEGEYWMEN